MAIARFRRGKHDLLVAGDGALTDEEEGGGGLQELFALATSGGSTLHEGAESLVRFLRRPSHHYGLALPECEAGVLPNISVLVPQDHSGTGAVHNRRLRACLARRPLAQA